MRVQGKIILIPNLFNAKTEEDLQMIKNISIGIFQAVEVLQKLSLSRAARWHFEQSLKARRDRWAEDEYVRGRRCIAG